jgi:hypothetical protein
VTDGLLLRRCRVVLVRVVFSWSSDVGPRLPVLLLLLLLLLLVVVVVVLMLMLLLLSSWFSIFVGACRVCVRPCEGACVWASSSGRVCSMLACVACTHIPGISNASSVCEFVSQPAQAILCTKLLFGKTPIKNKG